MGARPYFTPHLWGSNSLVGSYLGSLLLTVKKSSLLRLLQWTHARAPEAVLHSISWRHLLLNVYYSSSWQVLLSLVWDFWDQWKEVLYIQGHGRRHHGRASSHNPGKHSVPEHVSQRSRLHAGRNDVYYLYCQRIMWGRRWRPTMSSNIYVVSHSHFLGPTDCPQHAP